MTGTLHQPAGTTAPADLAGWLELLWAAVRRAVALRAGTDPEPDDPHRGLFLTRDGAARVLAEQHPDGSAAQPLPAPSPDTTISRIAVRFGLSTTDLSFLAAALGPDLDPRLERLYGYLNDDLSRRRATVGLVLDLFGLSPLGPQRRRLSEDAPLRGGGLVNIEDADRPALGRTLRVPDVVTGWLLGHPDPDPELRGIAELVAEPPPVPDSRALRALLGGIGLLYLSGTDEGPGPAAGLLAATGRPALALDPRALCAAAQPGAACVAALRTARWHGAGVVLGPVTPGPEQAEQAAVLDGLLALAAAGAAPAVPIVLYGPGHWDPQWLRRDPLALPVPTPDAGLRQRYWSDAVYRTSGRRPDAADLAPLAALRLGPDQVTAAAATAARLAAADGAEYPDTGQLWAGVRAQNGAGLARLARRITPTVGPADLVLPATTRHSLAELTRRARHRETVLGRWRMRPGGGRGHGVSALFAGESGTGKTMSAEVLAAELGMDLYVVDLSTVVDKYIGQTEKNLERIFTEAAGVSGVLLFDEADAIFGKRSDVSDAHDRYANLESAYLLTRMETFDGIAVLTTNLRSNVDEAFTRRLDVIADFPMPEPEQRRRLWDACLGTVLTRADDLDLELCAERFELSGGSIRSAAITAAYRAAETGAPLSMVDLIAAVAGEYRKLGRLVLDSEFGGFAPGD